MSDETVSVKKALLAQLIQLLNVSCRRGAFELAEAASIYNVVVEVQKSVQELQADAPAVGTAVGPAVIEEVGPSK